MDFLAVNCVVDIVTYGDVWILFAYLDGPVSYTKLMIGTVYFWKKVLFCDQAYRSTIKHLSTRWLSLEFAAGRSLKLLQSLKSSFLSVSATRARFLRLQQASEDSLMTSFRKDSLTNVYLLFQHSIMPFTPVNQFYLKRGTLIHVCNLNW